MSNIDINLLNCVVNYKDSVMEEFSSATNLAKNKYFGVGLKNFNISMMKKNSIHSLRKNFFVHSSHNLYRDFK